MVVPWFIWVEHCHNSDAAVLFSYRAIEADATHSSSHEQWAKMEAAGGSLAGVLHILRDRLEECPGN